LENNKKIRQKSFFSSKFINKIEEVFRSHPIGYVVARYLAGKYFYKYLGEKDFEAFNMFEFPENSFFLDVGANDGISAQSFRIYNKKNPIFSIEPDDYHEKSLSSLKKKIDKFDYKIAAVGQKADKLLLNIPIVSGFHIGQLASFDLDEAYNNVFKILTSKNLEKKIKILKKNVNVITLDSLDMPVCAIKIDVEGFELNVLKGAINLINNQKPVLLIEVKENTYSDIIGYLKEFNYSPFIYENKVLVPINQSKVDLNNSEFVINLFFINQINNFLK